MFALPETGSNQSKLRGLFKVVVGIDVAVCLLLVAIVSFGDPSAGVIQSSDRYGIAAALR